MNLSRSIRKCIPLAVMLLNALVVTQAQEKWVGSWAASQQLVEPQNSISASDYNDVTLRQIVHLTIGGTALRLHVSNRYGVVPLHITSVHIARSLANDSSKIDLHSDLPVTFAGDQELMIPAGAEYVSDALAGEFAPASDLAVSMHFDLLPAEQTGHPGSRATSYLSHGNLIAAAELPEAKKIEHWYFLSGVDVLAPAQAWSIVVVGDSITDGHGATTDGNNRWTDILARRLQIAPQTSEVAVLNHGIGGNRLLLNGLGPNALARFNDDVVAQAGVRYLIVLEGINDIGMFARTEEHSPAEHQELVREMVAAYEQMIARAHTYGIKVLGCTVLPFGESKYYHPDAAEEADRQAVNTWIRTPGHFDAVIDFDQVMRDPAAPDRLLTKFDSGDHLHPSPEGYAAMGNAIPLALLTTKTEQMRKGHQASKQWDIQH